MQISASEAHGLLQQILTLRDRRLRDEHAGDAEEREALSLAAKLIEGVVGWAAARSLGVSHALWHFLRETVEPQTVRWLAIEALKLPLPMMPGPARGELVR